MNTFTHTHETPGLLFDDPGFFIGVINQLAKNIKIFFVIIRVFSLCVRFKGIPAGLKLG